MTRVLSLIADPGAIELNARLLEEVNSHCAHAGTEMARWRFLSPKEAAECEIDGDGAMIADALDQLRAAFVGKPIDINLVEAEGRRKSILVSDMDATAIMGETLDDVSGFTPFKTEIDELTRRSVEGAMSFAETLLKRVELMRGLDLAALEKAHARVRPSRGIKTLVRTMRAHGALTALVSGGFRFFTARVREEIGFDLDFANELELVDGRLSGRLAAPIVDPEAKAQVIHLLARNKGVDLRQTIAVGDGSNDIPMLLEAGLGVAYRGKSKVKAAISVQISHADLTALLYLQGYHRDEFASAPEA